MQLRKGDRLGPYEILASIGAGGMGEVYRARDPRLDRIVAVKVLPDSLSSDETHRARFEKEARSIAALSHPNICAIYDVGSAGAVHYLVMEYIEGETLEARLGRGSLPRDETLRCGIEIAGALAAAHRQGIVHRDLKPGNVMITRSGARLLDFGLARQAAGGVVDAAAGATDARTMERSLTADGTIVGTLQYMSPEQLHGLPIDHRSDIFALGTVLYEMATGQKAFTGTSRASLIAAILGSDPLATTAGKSLTPAAFDRIVRTCLAKNPDDRWESAADVARELTWIAEGDRAERKPVRRRVARIAAALGVLAAVALLGIVGWRARRDAVPPPAGPAAIRAVAVLPFENVTKQRDTEFLSDGITEGLINTLSKFRDVRVIARTTAFTFKGKPLDLDQVRRQLDVDAVLTGKVVSREAELVVQADLIDTRSGAQLWGDRYVRSASGVLAIEQEIVGQITDQIRPKLETGERERILAAPTMNAEAYSLYMKGQFHASRRTRGDLETARTLFEEAVKIDPLFALAHVGIADSFALINYQGGAAVRREYLPKAEAAARRALQIAPDLGEAYATLGLVSHHRFHFRSAERLLRRAVELNSNYAAAHHWLGMTLGNQGRNDEAIAEVRKAQQLDPLSGAISAQLAVQLNARGDYAAALAESRTASELIPDSPGPHQHAGWAYEAEGEYEKAAAAYGAMPGRLNAPHLARLAAKQGRTAEALAKARELEQEWKKNPHETSAAWIASVYAALGDRDRAFEWLERALAAREMQIELYLPQPALFGAIRSDPRFDQLRQRMFSIEDEELGRRGAAPAGSSAPIGVR